MEIFDLLLELMDTSFSCEEGIRRRHCILALATLHRLWRSLCVAGVGALSSWHRGRVGLLETKVEEKRVADNVLMACTCEDWSWRH